MSSHENGRNGFRKEPKRKTEEKNFYATKGGLVPVPECRELFPKMKGEMAPSEEADTLTKLLLAYGQERGLTEGEVMQIIKANAGGNYAKALDFYAALKGGKPGCGYAGGDCTP